MNIYMEYSYNYNITTQDHGSHSRHNDIDDRKTLLTSLVHVLLSFPFIIDLESTRFTAIC